MLVTLMGKNNIYKLQLSDNLEGSYWIKDENGKEILNIKKNNFKRWEIISNKNASIINSQYIKLHNGQLTVIPSEQTIVNKIILIEHSTNFVVLKNTDEVYILYCEPEYQREKIGFDIINSNEIIIGRSMDCDIIFDDPLINKEHFRIFLSNGIWMIENFDTKIGVFVNNIQIGNDILTLKNGDIIYLLGIKFLILENSIYMFGNLSKLQFRYRNLSRKEINDVYVKEDMDEINNEIELYNEKDYFFRAPKIVDKIVKQEVEIDPPPNPKASDKGTMLITLASSLAMGLVTIVSLVSSIDRVVSGKLSGMKIMTAMGMPMCMLLATLVIPIIKRLFDIKQKKKYEDHRQHRYRKYINHKILEINDIMEDQMSILEKNNVCAEESERIILEKDPKLWERKIQDEDFLSVRVGKGDVPLEIHINEPKESFTMEDDILRDIYNDVAKKSRTLKNAPISVSLLKNNISAIISKNKITSSEFTKKLIMQIIALHSYTDLKIVFLMKQNEKQNWDFAKMLPHVWDNTKSVRFFSYTYNDNKNISKYLEEDLKNRLSQDDDTSNYLLRGKSDYTKFSPYYLIITDNYINVHNLGIIDKILKMNDNYGYSLLCIADSFSQLPNECKLFIELQKDRCNIIESNNLSKSEYTAILDKEEDLDFETVSRVVSNIPVKVNTVSESSLPNKYNFLEMYKVGKIDQLNVLDRWSNNDSTISLQAQIGIDSSGVPIYLDAHEKFHGPHGLIAGTTGSGKSEFIITYILSMAINYHPDDVTFVLVDYKGGGLAGAFKKKDIQLPHLVGTITNIDTVGLQRSLESIQSELRRRQIMFNEAKDIANESTIDIYKYQKYYHKGVLTKPISHLFIICDEFAELKQQQPEFMSELMSVSRIGRSLGVHLILATQKPSGVVNDQIRSNSKFGICLKVQSKSDSKDIIQKIDACTLKKAGQFYINVGNDEYFALGQSGYTGAPYIPSEDIAKDVDNAVDFISNTGEIIKSEDIKRESKVIKGSGDQLTNIVRYLANLAEEKNIRENQLWLDPIPEKIYVEYLRKKYKVKHKRNCINPIFGEYDDPFNQLQGLLTLNFSEDGNTILYGSADSGKEMLINTVIYDTTETHRSDEVQFYILDYGAEIFKMYIESPYVGDVVCSGDDEKLARLFKMLNKEIKIRKDILLSYNGDYRIYNKKSGNTIPMIIIVINEIGGLIQEHPEYESVILNMTKDCMKYGIVFFITVSTVNDVRGRLLQNFRKKITLQLIKSDDYYYVFTKARRKQPSSLYGRGLISLEDDKVYEFQTARMCELDETNEFVKDLIKKQNSISKIMARPIPVLPKVVRFEDVKDCLRGIQSVPIGIYSKNIEACTYDFSKNVVNIITAKDLDIIVLFIKYLLKELNLLNDVEIIIFDEEKVLDIDTNQDLGVKEHFEQLSARIQENAINKEEKHLLYVIVGINKFISGLGLDKEKFTQNMKIASDVGNCSFIIIDNVTKIKQHQMDSWFKSFGSTGNALWIGNGFDSQFAITCENDRRSLNGKCGNSMGYLVINDKAELVKLLGIKEDEDDENE